MQWLIDGGRSHSICTIGWCIHHWDTDVLFNVCCIIIHCIPSVTSLILWAKSVLTIIKQFLKEYKSVFFCCICLKWTKPYTTFLFYFNLGIHIRNHAKLTACGSTACLMISLSFQKCKLGVQCRDWWRPMAPTPLRAPSAPPLRPRKKNGEHWYCSSSVMCLCLPRFMGWTHWVISHSSQCSTTGVTKAVVCAILSGMVHIKEPLLLPERVAYVVAAGFLSHYLSGPLPYVWRHITVNKMCWVRIKHILPSFLPFATHIPHIGLECSVI